MSLYSGAIVPCICKEDLLGFQLRLHSYSRYGYFFLRTRAGGVLTNRRRRLLERLSTTNYSPTNTATSNTDVHTVCY